jgi:tetrahydromethanopterin S-methyltransferase subunit B
VDPQTTALLPAWLTFDRAMTLSVAVVTVVRWYWDRQMAKTLDLTHLTTKVSELEQEIKDLRESSTANAKAWDTWAHELTSRRIPGWLKELKKELEEYIIRESDHLKELFRK